MSNITRASNSSDSERAERRRRQMALIPDIAVLRDEESSGEEGRGNDTNSGLSDAHTDATEGSGVEGVGEVVDTSMALNGVMDGDDGWDSGESDTSGDVEIELGDVDTSDEYDADDENETDETDEEMEVDELEDDEPEVVLAGFVRIARRYRQA